MATESQSATSLGNVEFQGNEFASLLNKEFKPKTDEARGAIENARANPGSTGAGALQHNFH